LISELTENSTNTEYVAYNVLVQLGANNLSRMIRSFAVSLQLLLQFLADSSLLVTMTLSAR
jgi:hypothetical protein